MVNGQEAVIPNELGKLCNAFIADFPIQKKIQNY